MKNWFKLLFFVLFFTVFSACRETPKTELNQEESAVEKGQVPNKHVAAGGTYSFERPEDFGLAVNNEQILKKSYIPPCKEGFNYCLYYNGDQYKNTNFESAGVVTC